MMPGETQVYYALGELLLATAQPEAALRAFEDGIKVTPGAPDLYAGIAGLHRLSIPPALAAVDSARANLGAARARVADLHEKLEATTSRSEARALELRLTEAERLSAIAEWQWVEAKRGVDEVMPDYELAIAAYEQALALQPSHERALLGLGSLIASVESTEEGLPYYLQAKNTHPNSVPALLALGQAYLRTDQIADAVPLFEQALRFDPDNEVANGGLAIAYRNREVFGVADAAQIVTQSHFTWERLVDAVRARNRGGP
jgi:tetratricopeptide (TPR) repeat protein